VKEPKKEVKKTDDKVLKALEARLSKSQWLGGAKPSQEDKDKASEVICNFDRKKFPFTFAWMSLATHIKIQ